MNDIINIIIWMTLPIWYFMIYLNVKDFCDEPKLTAIINGTVLWLLVGGTIAINYTFFA